MFSRDTWKEIFEAIAKNKLRTFLTGFTVALGILIFVTLLGMGNGLQNTFNEFFNQDAVNVLRVYPSQTTIPFGGYKAKRQIEFKNEDLDDITAEFLPLIDYLTPQISRNSSVAYKNESDNYTNRGVGPGMQWAEKNVLMAGRYINSKDIKDKAKVAVIGRMVKKDLFKGDDPIGKYIDVGGSVFKVVGVYQDDGGDNEERVIFIPFTTRQLIEGNNDKIDNFVIGFKESLGYAGAMDFQKKLNNYIRKKKLLVRKTQEGFLFRM